MEQGVTDGEIIINGRKYQVTYDPYGLGVTNTFEVEQTDELIAKKVWEGTILGETARPDIWFELWRSGGDAGDGEKVVDAVKVENDQHNFGKQNKTDNNGVLYTYFVKEVDANGNELVLPNYSTTIDGLNVTNTVVTPNGKLTIKKVFIITPSKMSIRGMQSFVFDVTGPYGYTKVVTITGSGEETLENLYEGEYQVTERALPDFDITYNPAEGKVTVVNGETKIVTVTNTVKSTSTASVNVIKAWGENVPAGAKVPVVVYLIKNGTKVEGSDITLNEANGWTHTWTGLEKYKPDSSLNVYTVGEELEDPNIISTIIPTDDGYKITNDVRPPGERTGKLIIIKEFNNNPNSKVGMNRNRSGDLTFMVTVTDPYGQETRHEIKVGEPTVLNNLFFGEYTVVEDPSGEYSTVYDPTTGKVELTETVPQKTVKVINTVGAETGLKDITVTKTWKNGSARTAGDVSFKVTRTSTNVTTPEEITKTPTSEESIPGYEFKYTWSNLEVYDSKGGLYNYNVEELGVTDGKLIIGDEHYIVGNMIKNGYDFIIENTFVVQNDGEAIANKVWDMSGAGALYPNPERVDVYFKLYRHTEANTTPVEVPGAELKLIAKDAADLSVKWTNLDISDDNNNKFIFTVKEVDASGNDFTPENFTKIEEGLTVTNKIKSENERDGKLTVKKELIDNSVIGTLSRGLPIKFTFNVTGPYGYNQTFELAPGESKELTNLFYGEYTVEETDTQGYVPTYNPDDGKVRLSATVKAGVVTITNKHKTTEDPNSVEVVATKNWVNGPADTHVEIKLDLMQQSSKDGSTPVNLNNNPTITGTAPKFTYTWTQLPKHDPEGYEYIYYVVEPIVPENYEVSYSEDKLTVTNTYKVPQTDENVVATKVWVGRLR